MNFSLIRSNRHSIAIRISETGEVIVHAPFYAPLFSIEKFVEQKSAWIEKNIQKTKQILIHPKKYNEGEVFLYLGETVLLTLTSRTDITLHENQLLFPHAMRIRAQKEIASWYKRQAEKIITQRVIYHAEQMQTRFGHITFSDTKSKWGSCSAENDLQFNWRLIMAPLLVVDYVVIHELTHTQHKNHSTKFWNMVKRYTPAYKQYIKWLKDNGKRLIL